MDLIKTITDWPVIVQGALGSALFWAFLEVGQRSVRRIAARLGEDKRTANWFALAALEATGEVRSEAQFTCLYAALHYLLKALLITVMSLAIGGLIDVFASVGYLIAVYFLFRALAYVPHVSSFGPAVDREQKFQESLIPYLPKKPQAGASLEPSPNNPSDEQRP